MGNKNARKREIRKPKKKTPKPVPKKRDINQLAAHILDQATK